MERKTYPRLENGDKLTAATVVHLHGALEDHTIMRPFTVLPRTIMAFHDAHGGGHH